MIIIIMKNSYLNLLRVQNSQQQPLLCLLCGLSSLDQADPPSETVVHVPPTNPVLLSPDGVHMCKSVHIIRQPLCTSNLVPVH